jgi:hypothetical protein
LVMLQKEGESFTKETENQLESRTGDGSTYNINPLMGRAIPTLH